MTLCIPSRDAKNAPLRFGYWIVFTEIGALLALLFLQIWRIREFSIAFIISILCLGLTSNAIRGRGCAAMGLCWRGFQTCLRALWAAILAPVVLLLAGGIAFHTVRAVSWQAAVIGFLIYCAWGLFQQCMLNGYLLNRLMDIPGKPQWGPLMISAGVFSAIHAPNWFLMAVTLPAGYLAGLVYLRHRNLFVLGLAHALIGSLLYLVVPDWISHSLYVGPNCWAACGTAH